MSSPIRTRTAKLAVTGALALGSAGLLAGPAWAQYPPPSIDVTVSTPGATIEIIGAGWGPGTQVIITRKRGNNAGETTGNDRGTERVTATVKDDGTFEAPVEIPEDTGGTEIQYEVAGVDEQGRERTEARAVNVQLASAEAPADVDTELAVPATPAEDDSGAGLALALGGAAALAGGAVVARRKVGSKA